MKSLSFLLLLILAVIAPDGRIDAAPLVSPFSGSSLLGRYEADFEQLMLAREAGPDVERFTVEGRLASHAYRKPDGKTNLEIFRSYEKELRDAGFAIDLAYSRKHGDLQKLIRELYREKGNALRDRPYRSGKQPMGFTVADYIVTFPDHYLVAHLANADRSVYVAIIISEKKPYYVVDTLAAAAMETGTVALTLELLERHIQQDGKVAIYDIHFTTGSSEIKKDSEPALQTLATYIRAHPDKSFYLVGHTDDTGALEANLALSQRRAATVADELVRRFDVPAGQLVTAGVGPYAPVGSNATPAGRALNRRVELILRVAP